MVPRANVPRANKTARAFVDAEGPAERGVRDGKAIAR